MPETNLLSTLPLGALRAFDAAARHGSFKAAATELGVTPAAISHQIKALERGLGASLFERLNRALRLTSVGERLAAVTGDAFRRLEEGLRELDSSGLTGGGATLTISTAPSIAAKWLVPRLHRFQAAHPQIELRLQSGDALADVAQGTGIDIALRYGAGNYGSAVIEEKLWPHGDMVAVCAPQLLKSARLKRASDVLRQPLLRTALPARRGRQTPREPDPGGWAAWLAAAGIVDTDIPPGTLRGPYFGSSHLALDAAASGRGFALVPRILVADDLADGRFVAPFPIAVPDPFTYWLVCARSRAEEPRIRAFRRWVRREAEKA